MHHGCSQDYSSPYYSQYRNSRARSLMQVRFENYCANFWCMDLSYNVFESSVIITKEASDIKQCLIIEPSLYCTTKLGQHLVKQAHTIFNLAFTI